MSNTTISGNMVLRLLRAVFNLLAYGYALAHVVMLIGHFSIGERWNMVALYNSLVPLLLLPAPLLLILALLLRQLRLGGVLLVPLAALILWYGSSIMPKTVDPLAEGEISLTVMTHNLWFRTNGDILQRSEALIRDVAPDVVAMQEVSPAHAAYYQQNLTDAYPYHVHHPDGTVMVLSRYPITEDMTWADENGHNRYQKLLLDVDGTPVTLINVHFPAPSVAGFTVDELRFSIAGRSEALAALLEHTEPDTHTIIAGDFNLTDRSEAYTTLTRTYTDSHRKAAYGLDMTYPNARELVEGIRSGWTIRFVPPMIRIDYVYYDPCCARAISARALRNSAGSNHYPYVATLALR